MNNQFEDDSTQRAWMEQKMAEKEAVGGGEDLDSYKVEEEREIDLTGLEVGPKVPVGRFPMRITQVKHKVSKSNTSTPYAEITLEVIAGPLKGKTLEDRLMLEGPGRARLKPFLSAIGLMQRDQQSVKLRLSDFLNKLVWVSILHEKRTWNEEERTDAKVSFSGYESIDKYPLPEQHDPFAEANKTEPVFGPGPGTPPPFPPTNAEPAGARVDALGR